MERRYAILAFVMTSSDTNRSLELRSLRKLTEVAIALSTEKDHARLMQLILSNARQLTGADGGTLYSRDEQDHLGFEIMMNDTLRIHQGGTSSTPIKMPSVPLYSGDGTPNKAMVAAWAAVSGETVNIPDAYNEMGFDFSGTREFDERNGYRSQSFLTVPMYSHQDDVIGVLQLINKKAADGALLAFDVADQQIVESLASLAAIAITKMRLIADQAKLFESFIELMAGAVDDKSPYTGGHCRRVPELTMLLADAAVDVDHGPLKDFTMNEDDRYELRIAGWLHDCGKVTTPEYVMDKSVKLETIFDRMDLVRVRFEVLKRDLKLTLQEACLNGELDPGDMEAQYQIQAAQLDDDCAFLAKCNVGGERMSEEKQDRVQQIARYRWRNAEGEEMPLLSDEEIQNLNIERGTLTSEERRVINHHIVSTISMLESLPYPRHLARVPEFAGGHHECMDGSGYPRGLTRDQMSVQARIMGIADVFEALTATDRPYKKPMKLSQALNILGNMCAEAKIDQDLFQVFIERGVYQQYADIFLGPEQIDAVDPASIPGYLGPSVS